MSEEYSDYSEIFTPTDPRDRWDENMVSAMSGIQNIYFILYRVGLCYELVVFAMDGCSC